MLLSQMTCIERSLLNCNDNFSRLSNEKTIITTTRLSQNDLTGQI